MAAPDLFRQDVEPDATQTRGRAGEVPLDDVVGQPDRLEDLRAGVRGDGRDTHLAHDLQDALAERLDQRGDGLLGFDVAEQDALPGRSSTLSIAR